MQKRFDTCFRNVATDTIAMSRMLHSSNQNVLCGSELIVDHKTQTNVSKAKQSFLTVFFTTTAPRYL